MSKITLASYSLKLKDSKQQYLTLGKVLPSKDFIKFLEDFFNNLESQSSHDTDNSIVIKVTTGSVKKNNREFTGTIETGEYGYESTFIDKDSGTQNYKRKVTDAEMLPFYFLLWLPKDQTIGLLILQRFGLFGISKIFKKSLQQFIKTKLPNVSLEINPVYSDKLLQNVIQKGEIKRVTFTKYEIPSHIEDYFETGKHDEKRGYIEYCLVAKRNSKLKLGPKLNKLLFGDGTITKLVELKTFSYDKTKIEIKNGNETRRFTLGDFLKFRAYYDVSNDVKKGKDGHPEFNSINKVATKIKQELEEILYPTIS